MDQIRLQLGYLEALTLNLDLYFFSFFSYPGGEQHCFDYFGDSNFRFFYYFDLFYLEISFLFQPDFSLGSFVTDNDIL
ncbi:unnamed protein product [Rhizophagus irregularis]|nr:unnamed protein product [Rhizophagus irregularis]